MPEEKTYSVGGLVDNYLKQQERASDKEITLRILKGESYVKIAEELQEFTLEEIKSKFVGTIRKAATYSDRPTDGSFTLKEWIELVENM